jgi:endogenous inhibitor of DNA gyrase (YacG/DUF329 family)
MSEKRYDGVHCPECGGEVESHPDSIADNPTMMFMDVKCTQCGQTFTEEYKLVLLTGDNSTEYKVKS